MHTTARSPDERTETTQPTGIQESCHILSQALSSGAPTATDGMNSGSLFGEASGNDSPQPQGDLKMSLWLSYKPSWIAKFKQESPTNRAIMLNEILEAFSDGVEGINISFSEPE